MNSMQAVEITQPLQDALADRGDLVLSERLLVDLYDIGSGS